MAEWSDISPFPGLSSRPVTGGQSGSSLPVNSPSRLPLVRVFQPLESLFQFELARQLQCLLRPVWQQSWEWDPTVLAVEFLLCETASLLCRLGNDVDSIGGDEMLLWRDSCLPVGIRRWGLCNQRQRWPSEPFFFQYLSRLWIRLPTQSDTAVSSPAELLRIGQSLCRQLNPRYYFQTLLFNLVISLPTSTPDLKQESPPSCPHIWCGLLPLNVQNPIADKLPPHCR